MITPILEKYLLNGFAKNKIHNISYGMFSQIEIPKDSFIVIHKITWNGWLNQKNENIEKLSWKQFFEFTEYCLKVQSDKESPLYYHMRNEVNFQFFGMDPASPLKLLNAQINTAQYDDYILMTPKKPVVFDTWITAYDYLNFTISRNSLTPQGSTFQPVNNYAQEKDPPFGINGQNVLLDLTLVGSNGTQTTYNPPGVLPSHPPIVGLAPDNTPNYMQLLDKPNGGGDNGSFLNNPVGGIQLKYSEQVTNPLISLEYCVIQRHTEGKLSPL